MFASPSFFASPGPFSDLVLKCENGDLYAAKAILGLWSPVFRDLITNIEDVTEIPLPKKSIEQVSILLQHIYPPFTRDIEGVSESEILLSLAHEYNIAAAKSKAEAFLSKYLRNICETWDGSEDTGAMDKFAQALRLSTRYEAPKLKEVCEEMIVARPSPFLAILAERFDLGRALESCVRLIVNNFGDICVTSVGQDILSQLSTKTLVKIGACTHARMAGHVAATRAELNEERNRISSLRRRLAGLTFSTEHRDAMMCHEDWRDLTETFGSPLKRLSDNIHVSRTLRSKIHDAFEQEGLDTGTPSRTPQEFPLPLDFVQ
ncbi:hypothetical protein BSKO_04401 [Bryopsis sp. KO-2023]|nr:hypothetical protein BSKO_04401 [Bryopsis sp. KO-2023]